MFSGFYKLMATKAETQPLLSSKPVEPLKAGKQEVEKAAKRENNHDLALIIQKPSPTVKKQVPAKKITINDLNNDVLLLILKSLDFKSLLTVATLNKNIRAKAETIDTKFNLEITNKNNADVNKFNGTYLEARNFLNINRLAAEKIRSDLLTARIEHCGLTAAAITDASVGVCGPIPICATTAVYAQPQIGLALSILSGFAAAVGTVGVTILLGFPCFKYGDEKEKEVKKLVEDLKNISFTFFVKEVPNQNLKTEKKVFKPMMMEM